jgi:hypothetical protein
MQWISASQSASFMLWEMLPQRQKTWTWIVYIQSDRDVYHFKAACYCTAYWQQCCRGKGTSTTHSYWTGEKLQLDLEFSWELPSSGMWNLQSSNSPPSFWYKILPPFSGLKSMSSKQQALRIIQTMEAEHSSEIWVNFYWTKICHIPDDSAVWKVSCLER